MSDEFYSIDGRMFDRKEQPEDQAEIAQYQRSLPIIEEVQAWLAANIKTTESVDYIVIDEKTDMLEIKAQLLAQKYLRYKLVDLQAEFINRFEHLAEAVKEKRDEEKDSD